MEIESTVNAVPEQVVDAQPVPSESEHTDVAPVQNKEDAPQSKEENSKFAEFRRKAEAEKAEAIQKAKDELIAEQYGESHGIYTEADFKKAMKAEKERAEIEKLTSEKNYSEDEAKEILEARQIKAEMERTKKEQETQKQQQERIQQENESFLEFFKKSEGRDYDPSKDAPSNEVWELVAKGTPLKYAYMEHKMTQLAEGKKALDTNKANAEANVGSVKGDGVTAAGYYTQAQVRAMSSAEVAKNLKTIEESMKKWK